jgi:monoamine oxidase
MSRTPLMDTLRRVAALAMRSAARGEPLDEMLQRNREERMDRSRRRFLSRTAAGSAGLALAGCMPAIRTAPQRDDDAVVIVGAGIAGLTCAHRLRQAGVPVRVYEARERVGGRMLSLRNHFADGQVCELGGELIDSDHQRMHALVQEFGLQLDDLTTDPTTGFGEIWFYGGRRYSEEEIAAEFKPLAEQIVRDQKRLPEDAPITYAAPQGTQALDALSLTQYLDQIGCKGWLRSLIEVAYTTEMGLPCEQQSALNFIDFIGTDEGKFHIFGASDERFHVRGGNDLVIQKLAARVADAVTTGSALEALRQRADGAYVLTFRRGQASQDVVARRVVLALPFTTLRRVKLDLPLPPAKRAAIEHLRYGTNAKLMIGFNERVWDTRHRSSGITYSDLPLQTTWETSRLQAGSSGILTNFVGGQHGLDIGADSAKEQADRAAQQLEAIYPGIAAARAGQREVRMHWPTQEWTLGSYACYGPGEWTTLRGAAGESVGNLHFAGEHCAFDYQGFMEGGAQSGEWAAQAIVENRVVRAA